MTTRRPEEGSSTVPGTGNGALALRALLACLVCTLAVWMGAGDAWMILITTTAALALDLRHPLTFRNFFLLYTFVVFVIGAGVFHLPRGAILRDVAVYLAAFLAGYALACLRPRRGLRDRSQDEPEPPARRSERGGMSISTLEGLLLTLVALNMVFLAFQYLRYGIAGYYGGQALFEEFETYGQASAGGGAEQIIRFVLKYTALGGVVAYSQACLEAGRAIRYRFPVLLLIVVPVLALRRYDAVVGAITVVAVEACDRRLRTRRVAGGGPRRPSSRGRMVWIAFLMSLAVVSAVAIGSLRLGYSGGEPGSTERSSLLTSELSPVQAYVDIRTNIDVLGHTNGSTIVPPLLLKVVPRAWFPGKPLNSGGYYMSALRPEEFAAGFAIPPTFFGDAYLSFGMLGAVLACLALGAASARLDVAYRLQVRARIPFFLIVYANFYSLLRDPLSESLAGICLTFLVWSAANRLLRRSRSDPVPDATASVPWPSVVRT